MSCTHGRKKLRCSFQVYNITGEAQVVAAVKFLKNEALEWWRGLQASGRHKDIITLEQLAAEACDNDFSPLDRLENIRQAMGETCDRPRMWKHIVKNFVYFKQYIPWENVLSSC